MESEYFYYNKEQDSMKNKGESRCFNRSTLHTLGVLYTVIEPNKPLFFNLFPSADYHFPVYLDQNIV